MGTPMSLTMVEIGAENHAFAKDGDVF